MSCFLPQIPLLTDGTMALEYPESSGRPRRNRIHRKYLCWRCNHIKLAPNWHSNRIELYRTTSQFLTSCAIWCWRFDKHDKFNTKSPLSSSLLENDTNIVTSLISLIPALPFPDIANAGRRFWVSCVATGSWTNNGPDVGQYEKWYISFEIYHSSSKFANQMLTIQLDKMRVLYWNRYVALWYNTLRDRYGAHKLARTSCSRYHMSQNFIMQFVT